MITLGPIVVPLALNVFSAPLSVLGFAMDSYLAFQLSGAVVPGDVVDIYASNLGAITDPSQAVKVGTIGPSPQPTVFSSGGSTTPGGGNDSRSPLESAPPRATFLYAVRRATGTVPAAALNLNVTGQETPGTAGAGVTVVTGTAPIVSSGGPAPAISITPATDVAAGSLSAADKTKLDSIQTGTGVLAAGTSGAIAANITAASRILVTMKDPGAGAIPAFADFDVPVASRVVGAPGSFVINAIDNTKAVIATAVCTFDWLVIG